MLPVDAARNQRLMMTFRTIAAAATTIMVCPSASRGTRSRVTASHATSAAIITSEAPLISAAKTLIHAVLPSATAALA